MLTKILMQDGLGTSAIKEGDLYKEVTIGGQTFRLVYGYYEDFERKSPYNEPIPIYPDFINKPVFTDEGIPVITAMQDVCENYFGRANGEVCSECVHFSKSEELFGLCGCPKNRQTPIETEDV